MPGEAREVVLRGNACQPLDQRCGQHAGAADIDIQSGIGRGDVDVERLACRAERFRDRPGSIDRAVQLFREYRAAVDRDQMMGACGGETDLQHVVAAAPRVEYGAATAITVSVDQVCHRRIEACLA